MGGALSGYCYGYGDGGSRNCDKGAGPNPFLSQLRATFKRSASETQLDYQKNMDTDHGLSTRQKELIRLSWRCMNINCKRMGGPGYLIFNRMIVIDPELQSVFGFNYCGIGNNMVFEGHHKAFLKLIDFLIMNLDSPPKINCKYLREIGYKHKSTSQVGFHSNYMHTFSVAVLDTVASALNPGSRSYCMSANTWRSLEPTADDKEDEITVPSSRNSLKTPDSQRSISASIRRNIFKRGRDTNTPNTCSTTSSRSHGPTLTPDDIFLHEQIRLD